MFPPPFFNSSGMARFLPASHCSNSDSKSIWAMKANAAVTPNIQSKISLSLTSAASIPSLFAFVHVSVHRTLVINSFSRGYFQHHLIAPIPHLRLMCSTPFNISITRGNSQLMTSIILWITKLTTPERSVYRSDYILFLKTATDPMIGPIPSISHLC